MLCVGHHNLSNDPCFSQAAHAHCNAHAQVHLNIRVGHGLSLCHAVADGVPDAAVALYRKALPDMPGDIRPPAHCAARNQRRAGRRRQGIFVSPCRMAAWRAQLVQMPLRDTVWQCLIWRENAAPAVLAWAARRA